MAEDEGKKYVPRNGRKHKLPNPNPHYSTQDLPNPTRLLKISVPVKGELAISSIPTL